MKTVPETAEAVCGLGAARSSAGTGRLALASVLAGIYIAFGGALAIRAGAGVPPEWGSVGRLLFAGVFPLGLLLVVFGGAALFTGDVMYVSAAVMRGKARLAGGARALCLSWAGNLAGALLLAVMIHWTGIYLDGGGAVGPYVVALAAGKCSQGFWQLFVKGVLCNQLVCLAVFMSLSARDPAARALLIWPPIFGFVALGMEHSVANMFFIPAGILTASALSAVPGPDIVPAFGWGDFLVRNLVPVTLGNVAGGALFVAAPYCLGLREARAEEGQAPDAGASAAAIKSGLPSDMGNEQGDRERPSGPGDSGGGQRAA
ncbi:MAG: formate/nitrite transporter family protein [Deltaproteobacteria bacterium]|jgi:formate/nitrite transporter|nr:formate/nitrite transporter family protein [Deltaproteobacteria bacterium]